MDKQLLLFGLMRKAGRIALGDEPVTDALRRGEVRTLCLACDAADNTIRRFTRRAEEASLPCLVLRFDKKALGEALGRASVAVVGVCDIGFAARLCTLVEQERPADTALADAAEQLRRRADRLVAEQKKKRADEKAARRGARPAPAPPKSPSGDPGSTNREAPRKIYGKPPGGPKPVPLGQRREQDAQKAAEKPRKMSGSGRSAHTFKHTSGSGTAAPRPPAHTDDTHTGDTRAAGSRPPSSRRGNNASGAYYKEAAKHGSAKNAAKPARGGASGKTRRGNGGKA